MIWFCDIYIFIMVTFGIDEKNLIIQFPVFVQPYTQKQLILYQIETVPVPILDENEQAQLYTQLKIDKPYIALNSETYISLHRQDLDICKRIGYEFYCEELFVVKSKARCSCASGMYFDLGANIIKENYDFEFYFNETNIKPSVLVSRQQIILVNWSGYKRIVCSFNEDIPEEIPSHPYVILNRSILCNCDIEAESNFLLESLAVCDTSNMDLLNVFYSQSSFC